jgi:hypothetical protein
MTTRPSVDERRARIPWALVPVALLLCSALGVGSMAIVAVRDPHFATEPDYYQKAIRWDQSRAQAANNSRLGYMVKVPPALRFDAQGHATLDLTLSDGRGQPVSGARLEARAFANAFSGELLQIVFEERAAGHYSAKLTVRHAGQWVFEVAGDANGEHFTADLRADLLPGGAA